MATMLEREAMAVRAADQNPRDWGMTDREAIIYARAVLMAVIPALKRYDSDQAGQYEDERGDYVLFDDLDAILNEKDETND